MAHPITSKKRARVFSLAVFLLGLAILIFLTDEWWPGMMLVIGLPLAIRQYLLGRTYDMLVTLLVFVGTFITVQFDLPLKIFLPILFTLGAIYIFFRELFESKIESEVEREEDINHEIEERKKKK